MRSALRLDSGFVFFVLFFLSAVVQGQPFNIFKGAEFVKISPGDEISVFSEQRGIKNDSIELMGRGDFLKFNSEGIHLALSELVRHDYYKPGSDTLHYIHDIFQDTLVTGIFPLKEVSGIYLYRKSLTEKTGKITLGTLGLSLATMPFLLAMKDSPTRDVITVVNLVSTSTMLVSATIGIVFGKRKFDLRQENPGRWKVKSE